MQIDVQMVSIFCPECDERVAQLQGGLCPSCGFPLEELAQTIEGIRARYSTSQLQVSRSGQIIGVLKKKYPAYGEHILVVVNDAQVGVGFVRDALSKQAGDLGALRFVGASVAVFEPASSSALKKKQYEKKRSDYIEAALEEPSYPLSVGMLGFLAGSNLLLGVLGALFFFGDGRPAWGFLLLLEAIVGSTLLFTVYHAVRAILHTRSITAEVAWATLEISLGERER